MRRIVVAAGALAGLLGAWKLRDRHRREALAARRRTASADALAAEIRAIIRQYGFSIPDAAQRFTRAGEWTDAGLLAALDAFHGEAMRHDERSGSSSRDGAVFAFYDAGLAAVGEVLARRIASGR